MSIHASLNLSEEDDEFMLKVSSKPSIRGTLSKWTNYILGWQDRYVTCEEGVMSYYREENEKEFGCRGSISLSKATVSCHDFDVCRFDVTINDNVWYMRASDEATRQRWIETIEANKSDSAYESDHSSRGSMTSDSSFGRGLYEKLAELETFRDILCNQVDTLQRYFDNCAESEENQGDIDILSLMDRNADDDLDCNENNIVKNSRSSSLQGRKKSCRPEVIDFKGEAITFKATTAGIIATLSNCIDAMTNREDAWQKRLEKEKEKFKELEESLNTTESTKENSSRIPDYNESSETTDTEDDEYSDALENLDQEENVGEHPFAEELNQRILEHLNDSIKDPMEESDSNWELFAEEGELKMYKKELVQDGLICDPLKAVHYVDGVTAYEMCYYFWNADLRKEWEGTVEVLRVLNEPNDHTVIIYQTHQRVWPASQRDCLYLSSLKKVDHMLPEEDGGRKPHDTYIVCNFSVNYPDNKPEPNCVTAFASIALICQTFVTPMNGAQVDRSCLKCKFIYVADVNPGGWAPAGILRTIYKREYPKFLRNLTSYVHEKTKNKEIIF